jgi:hypothetical protein
MRGIFSTRIVRPALLALIAASATAFLLGWNVANARAARAPAVDVSSRVDIADGNCSFGPAFDRAFENMIVHVGGANPRVTVRPVVIGGQRLTPRLSASPNAFVGEGRVLDYQSVVRLRRAVRWNGLRLIGLQAGAVHEGASQSLDFADRPARVRAALRRIGVDVPLPPGIRDIPIDACSAQIQIETRGSASSLTCSYGC